MWILSKVDSLRQLIFLRKPGDCLLMGVRAWILNVSLNKTRLTAGLMARFGYAFSIGMKRLNYLEVEKRDLVIHSLLTIFEIMCFKNAFDSPIVLCAAYISLCRIGKF